MHRDKKPKVVEELNNIFNESGSVVVTHYHGLSVSDVTHLRQELKKNNANFKITKNTLAKLAAENTQLAQESELFEGPTAIAYSQDPVTAAKVVVQFSKKNESLSILGGVVEGKSIGADDVKSLAEIPSLDELRGKVVGLIQAPARNIASITSRPASKLAQVLKAYSEKQ